MLQEVLWQQSTTPRGNPNSLYCTKRSCEQEVKSPPNPNHSYVKTSYMTGSTTERLLVFKVRPG